MSLKMVYSVFKNLRGIIELSLTYIRSIISFSCPDIVVSAKELLKMILRRMSFLVITWIKLLIAQVEPRFSIPCMFYRLYRLDTLNIFI